ncbi:MAG: KEOPS complex kinase/ATPase Bud32 [Candidatus Aenigmatarchaeota archaeon]
MIIYQGAEAIIERIDEIIIKRRVEKKYRIKELDEKIRKDRNKKEIKLLKEVRRIGINVPKVIEESDFWFSMEYIDGRKLKDVLNENNYEFFSTELGKIIGLLHKNNIVHGDLTLSNLLVDDENRIWLIDFGLGEFTTSLEKKAEDLLTLLYSIKSSYPQLTEVFIKTFFDSYKRVYEDGEKVMERMKKILQRGRYVIRDVN